MSTTGRSPVHEQFYKKEHYNPIKTSLNLPFKRAKAAEIESVNHKMNERIIYSKPIIETTRSLEKNFELKRKSRVIKNGSPIEVSALVDF